MWFQPWEQEEREEKERAGCAAQEGRRERTPQPLTTCITWDEVHTVLVPLHPLSYATKGY